MMTIFAVITVARQVNGEYVFVKTDKGYKKAKNADARLKELKAEYTDHGRAKPVNISTPQGDATCICEVGVFEIEIDDDKENNG
jgi:hypothetical protein